MALIRVSIALLLAIVTVVVQIPVLACYEVRTSGRAGGTIAISLEDPREWDEVPWRSPGVGLRTFDTSRRVHDAELHGGLLYRDSESARLVFGWDVRLPRFDERAVPALGNRPVRTYGAPFISACWHPRYFAWRSGPEIGFHDEGVWTIEAPEWMSAHWSQRQIHIPLRPCWSGLLANVLVYGFAWACVLSIPAGRRLLRRLRGSCEGCGYSLKGLPGCSPCPECGLLCPSTKGPGPVKTP